MFFMTLLCKYQYDMGISFDKISNISFAGPLDIKFVALNRLIICIYRWLIIYVIGYTFRGRNCVIFIIASHILFPIRA